MKKYRKINLRRKPIKKESPTKLYAALVLSIAAMAWGFSQVPPKKPVQEVKPVVLYKPLAAIQPHNPPTIQDIQIIAADIDEVYNDNAAPPLTEFALKKEAEFKRMIKNKDYREFLKD